MAAELDDLELLATPERPSPRPLEYGDLPKLVYLQAVIKVWSLMLNEASFQRSQLSSSHSIQGLPMQVSIMGAQQIWLLFFQEVLRMYPPLGLGQIRTSQEDVAIGKRLNIPKGVLVWVPHHGIMNTKLNWESPKLFKPGEASLERCINFLASLIKGAKQEEYFIMAGDET